MHNKRYIAPLACFFFNDLDYKPLLSRLFLQNDDTSFVRRCSSPQPWTKGRTIMQHNEPWTISHDAHTFALNLHIYGPFPALRGVK